MNLSAFKRTAADIAAEVIMTRAAFSGAILLVEGPGDSRFIRRHVVGTSAQITICGGKHAALGAVALLSTQVISGYCAIVDRDYDDHKGVVPANGVFVTDTHDTETLLLSRRLATVLLELGDQQKIEAFESANGTVEQAVLARAEAFGKMRYLNDVAPAFGVGMEKFSPWKYTDPISWTVDETKLQVDFAAICGHSHASLLGVLAAVPSLNTWQDAQGHDAVMVLSIGLRYVLGDGKQVSEAQICSALRLSFNEIDFKRTNLYAQLANWEQSSGLMFLN